MLVSETSGAASGWDGPEGTSPDPRLPVPGSGVQIAGSFSRMAFDPVVVNRESGRLQYTDL